MEKRDIKDENCTVLQLSRNAKFQAQKVHQMHFRLGVISQRVYDV